MSYAADFDLIRSNVPAALRERPQWVCWRYENRGGKPTKVPQSPKDGRAASTTDPTTWGTFDEAIQACLRCDDFSGVGYVFAEDDPYAGVDLDNCVDEATGEIKPWAVSILKRLDGYSETSPSGKGVKVFVRASKSGARCKARHQDGVVEMYDRERFFTITGQRLEHLPATINECQSAFDAVYEQVFGASPFARPWNSIDDDEVDGAAALSDEQIIQLAKTHPRSGRKFGDLWAGKWQDHFPSQSEADSSIVFTLAFYTKDASQIDRIFRISALLRDKWNEQHGEQTYGQMTIRNALENVTSQYSTRPRSRGAPPPRSSTLATVRPEIVIDTDEHVVVGKTIEALQADADTYQRGGVLVRVIRDCMPSDGVVRCTGSAVIQLLPAANLRERMTRVARFKRVDSEGKEAPAHPTTWLVSAILQRGEWDGIRVLNGVSDAPVLRPDGTIWQTPGYDLQTGVLYEPGEVAFPEVHPEAALDDANAAREIIEEAIADFPFESDDHKAAWYAGLFTPLARFAFSGPSPLFLIDANVRGAGKGLLVQVISHIVVGREMPVSSYSHESDEMRKKLTAIAIAGDRLILLDNLEGVFGNDALDRALTSTRWKDRILGTNDLVDLPLIPAWYATGNNVQVAADTTRRIIHIRLDCLQERPEDRTGFKHANLLEWVDQHRPRLLTAALTILAAYIRRGRSTTSLTPFGSFEGWSSLVRAAVVWVGLPDPCRTRTSLAESADTTAGALQQIIAAIREYDATNNGIVIIDVIRTLYPAQRDQAPVDEASIRMRAALENLTGCPPGKTPGTRQIGNKLRHFRRRVVGGTFIDADSNRGRQGMVWRVVDSSTDTRAAESSTR